MHFLKKKEKKRNYFNPLRNWFIWTVTGHFAIVSSDKIVTLEFWEISLIIYEFYIVLKFQ